MLRMTKKISTLCLKRRLAEKMRLGFREVSNLKYEVSVSSLKVIHSKTIL